MIDERKYSVYVHINKINQKIYIGMTIQKPEKRWGNGIGYIGNEHFWRAIQKYGWDNFEHLILLNNLIKEEAILIEMELIKKYNSTNPDVGYNISKGGYLSSNGITVYQYNILNGNLMHVWDSAAQIERTTNMNANVITQQCSDKSRSKTAYGYYFTHNNYGNCLPKFLLEKINCNIVHTRIAQYNLNGEFIAEYDSITEAKRKLNLKNICIDSKISNGFIWKRILDNNYKDTLDEDELYIRTKNNSKRKCYQYDLDGIFLKSYNSTVQAGNKIGGDSSSIAKACRNKTTIAYGYYWRYEDDIQYGINLYKDELVQIIEDNNGNIHRKYNYNHPGRMIVYQYNLNGQLINTYNSATEAAQINSFNVSLITMACNQKVKQAYNYIWSYKLRNFTSDELNSIKSHMKVKKEILQYDLNGNLLNKFKSLKEASEYSGISAITIKKYCNQEIKKPRKYIWLYAD